MWQALTDPAQLREWAPFDADRSLGTAGATVQLTTVNAPAPHVTDTTITRADAPRLLEYTSTSRQRCQPAAPIAGMDALTFEGWQRLNAEYSKQFGVEMPKW